MSQSLTFTIPFAPMPKQRPRWSPINQRMYTPVMTRGYERDVAKLARSIMSNQQMLTGPLRLTLRFVLPRPKRPKFQQPAVRPDLDNFIKAIKDAFNGIVWSDDGQVTEITAGKYYDLVNPTPRTEVRIEEIA
jgi:Holliday junction resolvase RusA-like endonuclease